MIRAYSVVGAAPKPLLSCTSVKLTPSIWFENSPLTIQEAGLAGVPVIASDLGAMPELVDDGVNGLLFEARNADDLRAKMKRLLDEEDLLPRLRSRARRSAKDLDESAAEREEIYRAVLAEGAV